MRFALVALLVCGCRRGPPSEPVPKEPVELEQACDRHDAKACELLISTATQLCNEGKAFGCAVLGFAYQSGRGVPQDRARAIALSRRACEHGVPRACNNLGAIVGEPALYRRACLGGDPRGCANLAFFDVEKRSNHAEAAELARRACDGGEGTACTLLGRMVAAGVWLHKDDHTAANLYIQGCRQGDMASCTLLGMAYQHGSGIIEDHGLAVRMFTRACEAGDARACTELALAYRDGDGVAADAASATELFQKACAGGVKEACRLADSAGRRRGP